VEPRGFEHIYAATPGILATVSVRPGQRVRRGQELARLSSFVKELQYENLMTAAATQEVEIAMQRFLADPAREKLAEETLKSINQQLVQYKRQLRQLIIEAPCDGVVVAPPALSGRTADTANKSLRRWMGTPLEPKNLGCWLEAGTHLLSVAPGTNCQAVLLIDQIDRNDVNPGQMVEIKLDHRPGKTYRGEIRTISRQPRVFAPKPLSNKFGGDLPTITDTSGRERLTSDAYEAVVLLDGVTEPLLPGTRGTGRVTIDTRTTGQWIWRYVCRTVNFRL
jgi:putative peptide zinc metalloprotease protein